MTPEQFCYWLQGRAEMQPNNPPSAEEWTMISEHLQPVFRKETPVRLPTLPTTVNPGPQCGLGGTMQNPFSQNIC